MAHHDLTSLLSMARYGKPSLHMDSCSFCREQYDLALDFLSSTPEMFRSSDDAAEPDERGHRSAPYRLAAQTVNAVVPQYRLRRTWYLNNNAAILRVIEDTQRQSLTGFFIAEHLGDHDVRIRFDGIEQEFVPDVNGVFEIGIAGIDIEPMKVTLLRS